MLAQPANARLRITTDNLPRNIKLYSAEKGPDHYIDRPPRRAAGRTRGRGRDPRFRGGRGAARRTPRPCAGRRGARVLAQLPAAIDRGRGGAPAWRGPGQGLAEGEGGRRGQRRA